MVFNIQEDLIQEDDNKTQDHLASPLPGLISYYPPSWLLYYILPGFVSLLPASGRVCLLQMLLPFTSPSPTPLCLTNFSIFWVIV